MAWEPRLNKSRWGGADKHPVFTSLCFLTVDTIRPTTPHSYLPAFLAMMSWIPSTASPFYPQLFLVQVFGCSKGKINSYTGYVIHIISIL